MLHALHNDALGKLILRLSVGSLILLHGIAKLFNPDSLSWIGDQIASHGLPAFLAYGVLLGEAVAPVMAILGWQTRVAGLLMVGNMVVAITLAILLLGSGRMAIRPD